MKLLIVGMLFSLCLTVQGVLYFQLVIMGNNTPAGAFDKIGVKSLFFMDLWMKNITGYAAIGPGQIEGCVARRLHESNGTAVSDTQLRGALNRKLAGSQCPASCASSTSQYCKNIGCCGKCSRRQLSFYDYNNYNYDFKCAQAQFVEWSINFYLSSFCNYQPGCSIKAKIMKFDSNGVASPLCT